MKTKRMATRTSYINARVEPKLKASATRTLRKVGLSTSDAVTLFLRQVVLEEGMPFPIRVPNAESRRALREAARGRGKVFKGSTKDFFKMLAKGT